MLASCAGVQTPCPVADPAERARAAAHAGDWEEAARRWTVIFHQGGDGAACAEAARALCRLGDHEEAAQLLDEGLARIPDDPALLELHGDVLAVRGFNRAAESDYQRALELDPARSSALVALARVRLELGMCAGAREALERCMALGNDEGAVHVLHGRVLHKSGELREALQSYERGLRCSDPDARTLATAAELYFHAELRGQDPEAQILAQGWLERALALDPSLPLAHHRLALICEERGLAERAIEEHRRALALDPGLADARARLAALGAAEIPSVPVAGGRRH